MYKTSLSPDTYLKEYYELVKDQYPDISEKEFNEIALSQFVLAKKEMLTGNLLDIRIKYLGVFKVLKGRVSYKHRKTLEQLEKQNPKLLRKGNAASNILNACKNYMERNGIEAF